MFDSVRWSVNDVTLSKGMAYYMYSVSEMSNNEMKSMKKRD